MLGIDHILGDQYFWTLHIKYQQEAKHFLKWFFNLGFDFSKVLGLTVFDDFHNFPALNKVCVFMGFGFPR